jgi:ABC-type lipoprotein export system ATPase subunit
MQLQLSNISKWVSVGGKKQYILNDIDLSVFEGEFISIMGPSGSGKTTLLNIIGLLDPFDSGQYVLNENDISKQKNSKLGELSKKHFGFVFQAYHLIDELTVYENIETPLLYQKLKRNERKALVADMLDQFNIVGKKDLFPSQLSGGQQQIVGIARALISKPQIILADEPTGNLNSKQSQEIMELFQKLNEKEGVTIIQVTHSQENAEYGSKIIHLLDGEIERIQQL